EMPDKGIDRVPDEYARHHVNHHPLYDNQPQYPENVVWLPTGAAHGDKTGFPGNLHHGSHAHDGNNICEHCRMGFHRAQPHLEHPNMLPPVAIPCPECPSSRD
ncbi:octicosapeptide/phox/Bem1p domain kinase superfamily protein, partial [Trifolium medium]|nr:octicosapeptide/phox/Bem1p domain kinase superfamily protein [Trifolium medium]